MMPIFEELLDDETLDNEKLEAVNGGSEEAPGGIVGRNDRSGGNGFGPSAAGDTSGSSAS